MKTPPIRSSQMGVGDQVRSFVQWLLDGPDGGPVKLTDKRVIANYQRWAEEWDVMPAPSSIILAKLKAHPQVKHGRERVLDAKGNAVRNARGTPLRPTYYTISAKRAEPKLPGRVPVQTLDMVAHAPLTTRPAAKAAAPAAEPQQQPIRRAA